MPLPTGLALVGQHPDRFELVLGDADNPIGADLIGNLLLIEHRQECLTFRQ